MIDTICGKTTQLALVELTAAGKVLLIGIFFGAGVPIFYACGVKIYSWATGNVSTSGSTSPSGDASPSCVEHRSVKRIALLCSYLIFFITVLIVGYGIFYLTESTWEHYFS